MKRTVLVSIVFILAVSLPIGVALISQEGDMPFGKEKDIEFANATCKAIQGYKNWIIKSDYYSGTAPHGKILRSYFSLVNIDGNPYHVIIKENYGGEDASIETVRNAPQEYLAAVTIMVKREEGYDPENNNWFWAKFLPDGSLDKNEQGLQLAGRVGKGMNTGCIGCHKNAAGKDFFFSNDQQK